MKQIVVSVALTFVLAFVAGVVTTYAWNLIAAGTAAVDWQTSFRLAVILGLVLPLARALEGRARAR